MANTFDWIEIRTHDIERTAAFYRRVFGWTVDRRETTQGTDYWIFDTGGEPRAQNVRRGGFWLRPSGRRTGIVVYVWVDDIDATLERVTEAGGRVVQRKAPEASAFMAYLEDPSGNLLSLYQEAGPSPPG